MTSFNVGNYKGKRTQMRNEYEITFETKCYENDWEYLLKTNYLDNQILNCNIDFTFKQLIINNVHNKNMVRIWAQKKKDKGIIDDYYFVDDYIDKALHFFDLQKNSFGDGYYYSSSELVGLYLSKTKYHLHFSSDSFLQSRLKINENWICDAYDIMEKNKDYIVANPTWNMDFLGAKAEAFDRINDFFISYGFSDQCYLVKTKIFRDKIYNFTHHESERYPIYGGELFEKRVDSFMRTNNLYRLTSSKQNYIHFNFPRYDGLKKKLLVCLIKINIYVLFIGAVNIHKKIRRCIFG